MEQNDFSNFNIYEVMEEYAPDYSIFDEDSDEIRRIKRVIFNELSETERRIILSYAQLGNIRDTAKLFKVSSTTIYTEIKRIRNKIYEYID